MIFVSSRKARVVVARLERGEELIASVAELARLEDIDAGLVRGSGVVEDFVLHAFQGNVRREVLAHAGEAELAALTGSIALRDGAPEIRLHAIVGFAPAGGQLLSPGVASAGFVARARVVSVELAVEVLQDVHLDLRVDEATGLPAWFPSPRR